MNANLDLINATLFGNSATTGGGGLSVGGGTTTNLSNTAIAKSIGGDCLLSGASLTSFNSSWFEDASCTAVAQGDPMLGPLRDNGGPTFTHEALNGSGLIGAGDSTTCNGLLVAGFDQRGIQRKNCTIGSFEGRDEGTFFVIPITGGKAVILDL